MTPQLIRVLTLCLVLLIYLFFFRVLRAVWVGVRPTSGVSPRRQRAVALPTPPGQLIVRAPDEIAGQIYALGDELSLGRAAGCEITVDDTYASQMHARIFRRDEQHLVEDLGSTNGTYLNREKVSGPTALKRGDHVQVGSTVFEVTG
jgi:hypothetical protein